MSFNRSNKKNKHRVSLLSSAILVLSACSLTPDKTPFESFVDSRYEPTLADLERVDIDIQPQDLASIGISDVLESYRDALKLFSSSEERMAILRRMADLTMIASEEAFMKELENIEQPGVESDDLAALDDSDLAGPNYQGAINIYQQIIGDSSLEADLSETYYLLAKAYDLNGSPELSLQTLNTLIEQFPGSQFHSEVQFRRGEQLFLLGQYQAAADAYFDVINLGQDSSFYEAAIYKHGWSLYKQGDFDLAINDFVVLLDIYQPEAGFWDEMQAEAEALSKLVAAGDQAEQTTQSDAEQQTPAATENAQEQQNDKQQTTAQVADAAAPQPEKTSEAAKDQPSRLVTKSPTAERSASAELTAAQQAELDDLMGTSSKPAVTPDGGVATADLTAAEIEVMENEAAPVAETATASTQAETTSIAAAQSELDATDAETGDNKPKANSKKAISSTQRKILADTLRVTAMAFSNLEGINSIAAYFKEHGTRVYEVDVYNALASLYLYQERFKDAADAYEAFTQAHPLDPMAPRMSSRVIDTFIKGGFPSLVLPYKERFVTKYGVYSDYWKQATPKARDFYSPELKQHLVELANHYHALAQAGKSSADYTMAIRWYREYLTTYPKDKFAPEMNLLLAEALYASKNFKEAIDEFERSAYHYATDDTADKVISEKQEKAAYFSLLSYQEHINNLDKNDPEKRGWIAKRTSSALKFAKNYPQHKQTPSILSNVIEDQLALSDLEGAITTAQLIIKLVPPPPKAIWDKAVITYANGIFDMGRFAEAEDAINKVFEVTTLSKADTQRFHENRATAIYKQAEHLERNGQLKDAAIEFLRVAAVEPGSAIRPTAEYDAANLFLKLEEWENAIQVLEAFRTRYPKHELIATLPAKLSLAYEKTSRLGKAAVELESIAKTSMSTDKAVAQEALWQAASMHDKTKNRDDAIRLYKQYVWEFEQPYLKRVEAQQRLVELYDEAKDASKRDFWREKIVEWYFKRGDENDQRTQFLAAQASSQLAEPVFESFKRIKLTQPLKSSLKKKKRAMQAATKAYTRTAEIGLEKFTTESNHQIGEIYRLFAKSILTSDRPRGLDEIALEEYEILLEDQALPFEDKAIEIFEKNTKRTKEGTWDEWVRQSFDSLAKILPARYKKDELTEEKIDEIF